MAVSPATRSLPIIYRMVASGESRVTPVGVAGLSWVVIRRAVVAAYLGVLLLYIIFVGVPLDRVGLTLWIVAGLSVLCIGKGWRAWGRMMLDWLPFQGILLAYDYSYGAASHFDGPQRAGFPAEGARNELGMPLHVTMPVDVDKWLFGGQLPSQWLQEHLHANLQTAPWWSVFVTLCYVSHFVVSPVVAAALWIWARDKFRVWVKLLIALAVAGLTTYFLFPMSPPWLASAQGYIPGPDVLRISGQGWSWLGFHGAGQVLSDGQARSNPVAAMPSLHMATATLVAGFFWFSVRRWVRPLLLLYPALMAFTLVYSGEHYVTDEIAGVLYAAVLLAAWRVLRRRPLRGLLRREVPHREALLGTPDRAVDVVQHGRGEAETVGAEADGGVEPDERGVGLTQQVK